MTREVKGTFALFDYLKGYIEENGHSPSYRDIAKAMDYHSLSTVSKYLNLLRRQGKIQWKDGAARTIILAKEPIG